MDASGSATANLSGERRAAEAGAGRRTAWGGRCGTSVGPAATPTASPGRRPRPAPPARPPPPATCCCWRRGRRSRSGRRPWRWRTGCRSAAAGAAIAGTAAGRRRAGHVGRGERQPPRRHDRRRRLLAPALGGGDLSTGADQRPAGPRAAARRHRLPGLRRRRPGRHRLRLPHRLRPWTPTAARWGQAGFAGDGGLRRRHQPLRRHRPVRRRPAPRPTARGSRTPAPSTPAAGRRCGRRRRSWRRSTRRAGGNAYAVYAAGAGTTVHVTGGRVAGSPYDVFCGTAARPWSSPTWPAAAPTGRSPWTPPAPAPSSPAARAGRPPPPSRRRSGPPPPAPSRARPARCRRRAAGTGPFALTHNGGTGAGGAPITVGGAARRRRPPPRRRRQRQRHRRRRAPPLPGLRHHVLQPPRRRHHRAPTAAGPAPIYCGSGSYQLVIAYPGSQSDQRSGGGAVNRVTCHWSLVTRQSVLCRALSCNL